MTDPCRVLVRLQSNMKHFSRLFALLCHQLGRDGQQSGKAGLNDLVEVAPILAVAGLEAVRPAYSQKALQSSEDGGGLVRIQKLYCEVHK